MNFFQHFVRPQIVFTYRSVASPLTQQNKSSTGSPSSAYATAISPICLAMFSVSVRLIPIIGILPSAGYVPSAPTPLPARNAYPCLCTSAIKPLCRPSFSARSNLTAPGFQAVINAQLTAS